MAVAIATARAAGVTLQALIDRSLIRLGFQPLAALPNFDQARSMRTITAWQEDRRKQPWECGNSGAAGPVERGARGSKCSIRQDGCSLLRPAARCRLLW